MYVFEYKREREILAVLAVVLLLSLVVVVVVVLLLVVIQLENTITVLVGYNIIYGTPLDSCFFY